MGAASCFQRVTRRRLPGGAISGKAIRRADSAIEQDCIKSAPSLIMVFSPPESQP